MLAVAIGLGGEIIFATADGLGALMVGRSLQGAAVAMAIGASGAALRELLPRHPRWASRFTLLASTGGVALGPIVGGFLAAYGEPREPRSWFMPCHGDDAFRCGWCVPAPRSPRRPGNTRCYARKGRA